MIKARLPWNGNRQQPYSQEVSVNPCTRKAAVRTIGAIAVLVIANALLSGHSTQMARPPSASRTRRRRLRSFGNSL